jgi:hypothetical protein
MPRRVPHARPAGQTHAGGVSSHFCSSPHSGTVMTGGAQVVAVAHMPLGQGVDSPGTQAPALQRSCAFRLPAVQVGPMPQAGVPGAIGLEQIPAVQVPATWQTSSARQVIAVPGVTVHMPVWQVSTPLQAFPSPQAVPFAPRAQAPPVQRPVRPQGGAAGPHKESAVPFATGPQVPVALPQV